MIVLCQQRGFIYIPLSKVANTSILTAIALATGHPPLDELNGRMLVDLDWDRISYNDLLESDLFKFAFVRNPWDRLVSCYHDKIFRWRSSQSISPHFGVPTDWNFEQFVSWVVSLSDGDEFYNDPHFIPQHLVLCRAGRVVVDFVGRFERLADDWRSVSLRFGLGKLPFKNARPHQHYSHYFSGRLKVLTDQFYEDDIRLFDYRFEDCR